MKGEIKMFKYYLTQRPPMPGTFPMPFGNRVKSLMEYGYRKHIAEIGRSAWGYVEYEKPLHPDDALAYELVYAGGDSNG